MDEILKDKKIENSGHDRKLLSLMFRTAFHF